MKYNIEVSENNLRNTLRGCGYHLDREQRRGSLSFSRSLQGGRYPRFHIYYNKNRNELSLHLDQKASKYKGAPDHGAEYDGKLVEEEFARIKDALSNYE